MDGLSIAVRYAAAAAVQCSKLELVPPWFGFNVVVAPRIDDNTHATHTPHSNNKPPLRERIRMQSEREELGEIYRIGRFVT